jgi:hypothetical protein
MPSVSLKIDSLDLVSKYGWVSGQDVGAKLNELLGDGDPSGDGADAVAVGETVVINGLDLVTTVPIVQKRLAKIVFSGGARLRADFSAASDIWTIDLLATLKGKGDYPRGWHFTEGLDIFFNNNNGYSGKHALVLAATQVPSYGCTVGFSSLMGFHNANPANSAYVSNGNKPTVWNKALRVTGYDDTEPGHYHLKIVGGSLDGGGWLDRVADGCEADATVMGYGVGWLIDIVQGGFRTVVKGECLSRDGAVHVKNGSNIDLIGLHMEQASGGVNTSTFQGASYMILLEGVDYQCRDINLRRVNFGGGVGLVDMNLVIHNAALCSVDDCTFAANTIGVDIKLTGSSTSNYIGVRNRKRGAASGTLDHPVLVQDISLANFVSDINLTQFGAMQNSWVGYGVYCDRAETGEISLRGTLTASASGSFSGASPTAPILIQTFSFSWSPRTAVFFRAGVVNGSTGNFRGFGDFMALPDGTLSIVGAPAGMAANDYAVLSGVAWTGKRFISHIGSDGY